MSSTTHSYLRTGKHTFIDINERGVILRGVNLAGSSKFPASQPSYQQHGLWEEAEKGGLSFVNRPFNLEDGSADVHLARLRGWGFRILRYIVVWEALEHEGPGKYDDAFINYTIQVLLKCKQYGFRVYMDPHQDCWSRFCGGSGAPFWTLHACGLDPRGFTATQAAILHAEWPNADKPEPMTFPTMVWQTNATRLAAATMFTMFFAGKTYAPKCNIDGVNIQDYLQSHWSEAFGRLADAIAQHPELLDDCVLGWDSMNEPSAGWIGVPDLKMIPPSQDLKKYTAPTPLQAMTLGMGRPVEVETWDFGITGCSKTGTQYIDPKGRRAWLDPSAEPEGTSTLWGWKRDSEWKLGTCPWVWHGVWDADTGEMKIPDYFHKIPGTSKEVNFDEDFWHPYWQASIKRLRAAHPHLISFVAPPVFHAPPKMHEEDLQGRACLTPHYYDGLTLLSKSWHVYNAHTVGLQRGKLGVLAAAKLGSGQVRGGLLEQLQELREDALGMSEQGPDYPAMIGEIGIPFDMNEGASYRGKHKGDYEHQELALDASLNACDGGNGLSYTLWAYNPDNSHLWGDGFNGEDLSLWSTDDCSTPPIGDSEDATKPMSSPGYIPRSMFELLTNGARAVRAFCRPYPLAIVGEFKHMSFDIYKPEFELTIRLGNEHVSKELSGVATEMYIPFVHFVVDDDEKLWKETCPPSHLQKLVKDEQSESGMLRSRVLGSVDSNPSLGLQNWKEGPARLDLTLECTMGEVEVEGQVLKWRYAGGEELKSGMELRLVVRRGAYDPSQEKGKNFITKLFNR